MLKNPLEAKLRRTRHQRSEIPQQIFLRKKKSILVPKLKSYGKFVRKVKMLRILRWQDLGSGQDDAKPFLIQRSMRGLTFNTKTLKTYKDMLEMWRFLPVDGWRIAGSSPAGDPTPYESFRILPQQNILFSERFFRNRLSVFPLKNESCSSITLDPSR